MLLPHLTKFSPAVPAFVYAVFTAFAAAATPLISDSDSSRTEPVSAVADADPPVIRLAPVTVSAQRLPMPGPPLPFSVSVIPAETLNRSPAVRLDDVLRQEVPGFSLFRRSSSRVAHPTTQGVSLRNLGPNGAGRTLVLLDGMPLNDPFGGYVSWQRIPAAPLEQVVVTRGGGAGLFGNAALAGTIQLQSADPMETRLEAGLLIGNRDTWEPSLAGTFVQNSVSASFFAQHTETRGYPIVDGPQRGSIDRPAASESDLFHGRLSWDATPRSRLDFTLSAYSEDRENGTPMAANSSDALDFSVSLTQSHPALQAESKWQAWYQRRDFASLFTAVNASRTSETPALDQYKVPAESAGGSFTWSQQAGERHLLTGGLDYRWVEGATHERFRYIGNQFTRSRRAGGEQAFAGIFLEDTWTISPGFRIMGGGRLDHIQQFDGTRTERDRQSGATLLHESYPDSDQWEPNGRLGLSVDTTENLTLRAAAGTGFRQPTLNEFYRPFRVGNDITEANPSLEAESLRSFEAGLDWKPADAVVFRLTGFHNRLRDAVGNVTVGEGPGVFEPGGFVPAGGVLRQRQNIDLIEVSGIETGLTWEPNEQWRFGIDYLFSHAEVEKASNFSQLEGKRLAQAPRHVATASILWQPRETWSVILQGRYMGSQFEDDLNTLKLADCFTMDAGLQFKVTSHITLDLKVENLFDRTIQTGKTASGLVSIGSPRLVSLSARYRF